MDLGLELGVFLNRRELDSRLPFECAGWVNFDCGASMG